MPYREAPSTLWNGSDRSLSAQDMDTDIDVDVDADVNVDVDMSMSIYLCRSQSPIHIA